MAEIKQITKPIKVTKTNIDEVKRLMGEINQKLDEASVLLERLSSLDLTYNVEVDLRAKSMKKEEKV